MSKINDFDWSKWHELILKMYSKYPAESARYRREYKEMFGDSIPFLQLDFFE